MILINLTLCYIASLPTPTDPLLVHACSILGPELCAEWNKDPFTLVVNGWGSVQLTWTTMLLFVQFSQIARAMTTYESMKGSHTNALTSAITTGALSPENAAVTASNGAVDPTTAPSTGRPGNGHGHAHRRKQKEGCFQQWKKLLGLDTFVATALHGSRAPEVLARRRQNPYNRGCLTNCSDFWCDAGKGPTGVLFGQKADGKGLLGGEVVDYRKLYDVPAGMRYRSGGYEAVENRPEDV